MKTIIAGSRGIYNYQIVLKAIELSGFNITEVVSGGCRGVDKMGERWAKANKIPFKVFPADWDGLGKKAGPLRNIEMCNYSNALIAIWNTTSRGTANVIQEAKKRDLKVYIHYV